MLRLGIVIDEGTSLLKHIQTMSKRPEKANEFTTGQKLALAAGIAEAVAGFFQAKESPGDAS